MSMSMMTSNNVYFIASFIPLITEYLVNISKRRAFWSLNEDILKINDSDYQYAISIKEDTVYPCLHSPKTTKETSSIRRIQRSSIRRIQDIVCEYSGRYQAWSLLQETPIRRAASGLRPYHFTYPERKLTMEEMLYKFIDEGKREHDEMRAFICDFKTTNEILFKERNNSLIELRFGVQELLKVINNTPTIDCEVKGVTTRGGKTTTQDAQNNDTNVRTEEPLAENHDEPVESNEILTNDQPQKTNEPDAQPSNKIQAPPIPFPRRLRKEKEEAQQKKFLENLKQLHINLPFIEALAQMPKYAKFLKGLLTNKARLEEACTITMNEMCSAVLLNKLPSKEKDPGSFTIPCDIGQLHINNALAYLRASISLMPYTMYEKLGLGEPKATRISVELADRSIQYPRGIIENVLIKVDKFVLPIDFVILDMPEDSRVPIILGRQFLATAQAMIDVFNKKITLRDGDDEVIFDVDQSIKRPPINDECYEIDDLDKTINAEAQELLANDEPDSFLSRGLEKSIDQSDLEDCEPVECNNNNDSNEPIRRIASINTPYSVVQETAEPVKLEREHLYSASANEIDEKKPELKYLPNHLEYAYLHVLEKRKGAIAWKMSDIKGISPSYYTHKILMEDDFKPVIQPQRRLNPKVQEVVKNEIVKLLDFGLIYPILDSSWVSHIHVVPKKRGMTVVLNDNNELIPSRTVTGWRVCIDYRKLNDATRKDHFPLPIIDQMLERICGNEYYCFLDGFSGFFQILIAPEDQEKTTFTYRMLARCEETNLVLNWEKCHFMVKEGIVLGHKISRVGRQTKAHKVGSASSKLSTFTEEEIVDEFPNEHLMALKTEINNDEPWLFARFRVPKALISDQGTHFCNSQLENALQKYRVTHKLSTAYHPQTNGKTKVTNRAIKRILERSVGYNLKNWSEKLDDALWAFRTAYKTPTRCTPFRLVYGKACHLPVEIKHKAYWVLKQCNMDLTAAAKNRFMELNELMELRDSAYENTRIYKERTKKWHDSRLRGDKDFKDLVKEISTNIGREFTNIEILKCWSLETSRRLFNTHSCSITQHGESTEQIS
ncbi:DNA-directed DNA polymerase [Tanacetum coccineum]